MNNKAFALSAVNILLLSIVIMGFLYNVLEVIYINDVSHLSYFITAVIISNVLLSLWEGYRPSEKILGHLEWVGGKFLFLGLLGTLWGLCDQGRKIDINVILTSTDTQAIVTMLLTVLVGMMSTMFYCSILGIVGYLWNDLNLRIRLG